jgi:hypothetical protein
MVRPLFEQLNFVQIHPRRCLLTFQSSQVGVTLDEIQLFEKWTYHTVGSSPVLKLFLFPLTLAFIFDKMAPIFYQRKTQNNRPKNDRPKNTKARRYGPVRQPSQTREKNHNVRSPTLLDRREIPITPLDGRFVSFTPVNQFERDAIKIANEGGCFLSREFAHFCSISTNPKVKRTRDGKKYKTIKRIAVPQYVRAPTRLTHFLLGFIETSFPELFQGLINKKAFVQYLLRFSHH